MGRDRGVCTCPHRTTSRREVESRSAGLESSEARHKFAGAKAISSDMFFGREVDSEVSDVVYLAATGGNLSFPVCSWALAVHNLALISSFIAGQRLPRPCLSPTQYEARSRLQQLSGSSAISSSDLFGDVDGAHGGGRASVLLQVPNEHS